MRTHQALALGTLVLVVTGCGSSTPSKAEPVRVSGRVTDAKGKPVGNMMLAFAPSDAANKGERPMAQVAADGKFATSCVPGHYRVMLLPMPKARGQAPEQGTVTTPEKAKGANPMELMKGGASQPSWEIDVKSTDNDEFTFQVK